AVRPGAAARSRSSQTDHAELTRRARRPGSRGRLPEAGTCRPQTKPSSHPLSRPRAPGRPPFSAGARKENVQMIARLYRPLVMGLLPIALIACMNSPPTSAEPGAAVPLGYEIYSGGNQKGIG